MSFHRADRVAEVLRGFLAKLLADELQDPRVRAVTLTGIDVRRDLKHATVYFSIRNDQCAPGDALTGLKRATGFIRSRIAQELELRFVPTIAFALDDTFEQAHRIDALLRQASPK